MESLWYFDLVAYTGILCLLTSLVLLIATVILWTLAIKHKKRYQALEESKNMAAWLACKCLHFCSVLCADCFCFSRALRQLLWRLKTFFPAGASRMVCLYNNGKVIRQKMIAENGGE